jgi:D-ribose pyranase
MKSTGGILNNQLSRVIAEVGHTDLVVVTDAGLPIPSEIERVDLSVVPNIPRFLDVLKAVTDELVVEGIILAEEVKTVSPEVHRRILDLFPESMPVTYLPHTEFKQKTKSAKAAVRSGEFTPYANVILQAGVAY